MPKFSFSFLGGNRNQAEQVPTGVNAFGRWQRAIDGCWPLAMLFGLLAVGPLAAQTSSDLDLSTRSMGTPPTHTTVDSVARWMENPLDQKMQVTVSNLCAAASDYMEITIGAKHLKFYGAGTDGLGNYIPTNYSPVTVGVVLRREYSVSVMCPNSGPNNNPFFKISDCGSGSILDPNNFLIRLTNSPTDVVSAYLWANFASAFRQSLTNTASAYQVQQTNLISALNSIIQGPSIYNSTRFSAVTLSDKTTNLLAQNPTGARLVSLNRLLLNDAYGLSGGDSDNSGTADIAFSIKAPPELKIKKNRPAPNYTVLLNRSASTDGWLQLQNTGIGYTSMTNSIVAVIQDKFGHFGLGDGCDDATKAPGQGGWLTMGPGCNEETNRIALDWHVSLGRSFDGLAAGQLAFRESGLTRDSYTPYVIYYNGSMTNLYATETMLNTNLPRLTTNADNTITTNQFNPVLSQNVWSLTNADASIETYTNCLVPVVLLLKQIPYLVTNSAGDIYTNYDNLIRQVKAYQTFVDVVTPDTNQTVLKFYHAGDVGTNRDITGLYTIFKANPFVVWTIRNPNPGTANQLDLIENRNGIVSTQSLVKTTSGSGVSWSLILGSGAEQRVEKRVVSFTGEGAIPTERVEVNSIAYANSLSFPAYKCTETYHNYPWGWELKETRIPNNPDLATTYEYYDNQNNPESYSVFGNGQVKQIVYPDGYWEKRIYEDLNDGIWNSGVSIPGALTYIISPYMDGDGNEGEATSPRNAIPFNSIFTKYTYGLGVGGLGQKRYSAKFDGLHAMTCLGNIWETGHYINNSGWGSGWLAEAPCDESAAWTPYCEYTPPSQYGSLTSIYSSAAPLGLAGKTYHVESYAGPNNPDRYCYYDHGRFNFVENTFVLDESKHLYTTVEQINKYPDSRQTEFVYGLKNYADYYASLEDHSIIYYLTPLKTRRNVHVFCGGNLVQVEGHVYLNAGATNVDGTRESPQWVLLSKFRYYTDSLGRTTNITRIDGANGQLRVVYSADYMWNGVDDALLISETDETGRITLYTYDSLQRVSTVTIVGFGSQPNQVIHYAYDANGQVLTDTITAGMLTQTQAQAFDLSGRQTNSIIPSGISIGTVYSANNRTQTKTYPGGVIIAQEKYLDRREKSIEGNGQVNQYFNYSRYNYTAGYLPCGDNNAAWPETIKHFGAKDSVRWRATGQDFSGLEALELWPVGGGTTNTAWQERSYSDGFLFSVHPSPGFPAENYHYDECGNIDAVQSAVSWGGAGGLSGLPYSLADTSRLKRLSNTSLVRLNNYWYQATTNYTCQTDYDYDKTVVGIHLEQLNGFPTGVISCSIDYDSDNSETITTNYLDRANNQLTTFTSQPNTSGLIATTVYQNGLLILSSTLSVASPTQYKYDALGRTNEVISPLGYHAYIKYDSDTGWVTSQTDFSGQTNVYEYYGITETNAGKLKCQSSAMGKKSYYAYTARGELCRTWGDVPYPAEYRYNEYGDLTNLITFRGGTGWAGSSWPGSPGVGDNTYWQYDDVSGALLAKTDAKTNSVSYTYDTATGRLLTRTWTRLGGTVTVTNSYNGYGDLTAQEYSDGTPNVYFNDYNRAGQPREIVDGAGISELTYDHANRLVSAAYATSDYRQVAGQSVWINSPMAGITVSNHFNPNMGRDAVSVLNNGTTVLQDDYAYDIYGRLSSVRSGTCLAIYGYRSNSDLLQTTTCKNGNNETVLTTTRTWDYGMRLRSIANAVGDTPVTSHAYQYDALNRRTQATLEDGSIWQYGYNDRDELTNACRKWMYFHTATPVAGQQFAYNYDNIGNRNWAKFGGDTNGNNLQIISYAANSLNQYTGITTPGSMEIIGAALATNSVTVNGGVADRHGEYFHREISVANTNHPVWQNVTNIAGTFTNKGGSLFPANTQTLAYDADGNLQFDGIWTYQWDGENRLVAMWMTNGIANLATTNRLRLDFAYDYQGRRVQKIVSVWNVVINGFMPSATNRYLYDGWNLLAVVNPQASVLQSFMWGNDVSGTMDQAGGIGGLLLTSFSGTNFFACYGGSGNLTALISASDKSIAARYEYNPYGELLRATGQIARQNPFRFSTKFFDEESGLVYFGYRYYSPSAGRWYGRDGIGEDGGRNLLSAFANNPISNFDPLGQSLGTLGDTESAIAEGQNIESSSGAQAISFKNKVQSIVDDFDTVQEIAADLMNASSGDPTEIIMALLGGDNNPLSKLKPGKKKPDGFHEHHLFPEQFNGLFSKMGIDIDQFTFNVEKRFHQSVMHGMKKKGWMGGTWNKAWGDFLGYDEKSEKFLNTRSVEEIGKFAQQMLSVVVAF